MRHLFAILLVLALTACTVPKEAGFPAVQAAVESRSGEQLVWHREAAHREIRRATDDALKRPLTLAGAISLALLRNPDLQATYEQLGVAQADLVQAGMLENPTVGGALFFPTGGSPVPDVEGGFGMSFLSVFTIAARERVAGAAFEAAKNLVGSAALTLIVDVHESFYTYQAARQLAEIHLAIAQASQASYDVARELYRVGNINELQLARERALYEEVRLSLLDAQSEAFAAREGLTKILGLWGEHASKWEVTAELEGVPSSDPPLAKLETLAIRNRLDLAAARQRTRTLAEALGYTRSWGWLHGLEVGGGLERDAGGGVSLGPEASLALPLFDQGQAQVARAEAELRESYHETTSLAVSIRSDVRRLRNEMLTHRRKARHYLHVLVPLRQRIVDLTMEQYNFMLVGVFELLQSKQAEIETYREYLFEVRDYWISRAKLRFAVGGKLPRARVGRAAEPPRPPALRESPSETKTHSQEHSHDHE